MGKFVAGAWKGCDAEETLDSDDRGKFEVLWRRNRRWMGVNM